MVSSERGGIVNVGLEGIMTIGAFSSVVFNLTTAGMFGSMTPWLSILFGALIGALFSSLHAVATVNLRADHIVSGTVLNLMAPALEYSYFKFSTNKVKLISMNKLVIGTFLYFLIFLSLVKSSLLKLHSQVSLQ